MELRNYQLGTSTVVVTGSGVHTPPPQELREPVRGSTGTTMDDELYDEFGNYVGPELDDDSDGGSGEDRDEVCVVRRTL